MKISNETGGNYYKSLDEKTLNEIFVTLSSNLEFEMEYSTIRLVLCCSHWIDAD